MFSTLSLLLCWLFTLTSLFLALLILLPAPAYPFWLAAIVAGEWSVWLILAGITGCLCGAFAVRLHPRWAWAGIICGIVTILCATVPVILAYNTAAQEKVTLSLGRYLFGGRPSAVAIEERDIPFVVAGGQQLKLDIYSDNADTTKHSRPVLIVIHGGAWSRGNKSDFIAWNRWLAQNGYVVVDIEYRLANSATHFPAQIADVRCALTWVQHHITRYGGNPESIILFGRSAGGQLALLAGYAGNSPALPFSCEMPQSGIRAVVSFYGPIDLTWGYYHPGKPDIINTPGTLQNYLGGSPETVAQVYKQATPSEYITAQTPPTFFVHGGQDQLVSKKHVDFTMPKLQAVHVPYEFVYLPWANHGFDFNFNGWGSQIVQSRLLRFLKQYANGRP